MNLTQYNSSPDPLPDEGGGAVTIPDGDYVAECTGFKTGEYRSGGTYIEFEWTLRSGTCANLRAWQKTTLHHDDADRRKWGEIDRDRIAAAIGVPKLNDANWVVGKHALITLKTKGDYQNVVNIQAHAVQPPPSATTLPQQSAPAAPSMVAPPFPPTAHGPQPPQNQQPAEIPL